MPLYTYQCQECHQRFEMRRAMAHSSDAAICQFCGSQNTRKTFHTLAVIGGSGSAAASTGGGCSSCAARSPSACSSCR